MSNQTSQEHSTTTARSSALVSSRRGLFKALGLGASVVALKGVETLSSVARAETDHVPANPLPSSTPLPDGLNPAHFTMHSRSPLTLESKRHLVGTSVITSKEHLFVRNNLPMPDEAVLEDRDAWRVEFEGARQSKSLSLRELKGLGLETVAMVLQCSGNGRAFYTHGPSGSKWATGAAGCVVWSGVPVRDVVKALGGVDTEARYMTSTGGDPLPQGLDPLSVIIERSVPLQKGLEDALLAWEMNGAPIPLTHGGPVRMIVPGYFGCNQIKYVKRVAFTKQQTKAKIQHTGYRYRPIGVKGSPDQPSMWSMPVKSWLVNEPALPEGRQVLRGVALGGERAVKRVEVSVDGGKRWREAKLIGPDLGRFAWRLFTLTVELPRGEHVLVSRAYDDKGEVQVEEGGDNERGYGHTGWADHALKVMVDDQAADDLYRAQADERRPLPKATVTPSAGGHPAPASAPVTLSAEAREGREVFLNKSAPQCGVCHTLEDAGTKGVVGPNLNELKPDEAQVLSAIKQGIGAMPPQTTLSEGQLKALAKYVFEATR